MDLQVTLVESFTHAQRGTLVMDDAALSLNVRGLRQYRFRSFQRERPGPFLMLQPPRLAITFDYGPERENWAILFSSSDLRDGSRDGQVALRAGPTSPWSEIPCLLDIPPAALPALQQEFLSLRDCFRSPLAADRLRVQIAVMALVGRCLASAPRPTVEDPAGRLKQLLDADPTGLRSIREHSGRCGLGVDHLRSRFQRSYGLSPQAYRQQQRLAEAIRLLSTGELTISAIARQLGFRHASHFCAVFRARRGQTPGAARRRFRFGG